MNSASLCSLAGPYDNPIPTRFLAPIDCLKIPALCAGIIAQSMGGKEQSRNRVVVPARQATQAGGNDSLESILGLLKSLKFGLCDGIIEQSMGGQGTEQDIGLSYRPARLHRLVEMISWNRFLGSLNV
jgi:hypothetical protein